MGSIGPLAGVGLALLGFTLLSSGVVLTKAGAPFMQWKDRGPRDARFYRYLATWLVGFALYNVAIIPNGMASDALPPHVVSAISGWGIPVMVFLSSVLLKERLYRSDFLYSAGIVAGIAILNLAEAPADVLQIDKTALYVLLALPFLLLVPVPFRAVPHKAKAILLASAAGCIGGFALVLVNVAVKEFGFDPAGWFGSPYPYLFMSTGTVAFVSLQLAMRWGNMMLVGPINNSLIILYPALCSVLVYDASLGALQLLAIALIVASCVMILRKH